MAATVESNGRVGLLAGPVANPAGLFWFALTILSTLPLFRFGLAGLADAWVGRNSATGR